MILKDIFFDKICHLLLIVFIEYRSLDLYSESMENKVYYDEISGEYLGTPSCSVISSKHINKESLKKALDKYILSISGWRAVVAESGDEEDYSYYVSDEDLTLASIFAYSFYKFLGSNTKIVVGRDARPTGRLIGEAVVRTLLHFGADVEYIATSSAPEIMAYSKDNFNGFFYISASHNPVGHNGYKFGFDGGVYSKREVEEVKSIVFATLDSQTRIDEIVTTLSSECYVLDDVLKKHKENKEKSLAYYENFVIETAGSDFSIGKPIGIAVDFNGSARSRSIDLHFLRSHGIKVHALNNQPGQIVHGIVPEGDNLKLCRDTLSLLHAKDSSFVLGYVPDNDGDRGNLVYYSRKNNRAELLGAQQVFALIVLIDLAEDSLYKRKGAVAVNGCTSLIIEDIASRLNASVFHSDVGEANVVNLAARLRKTGYSVKAAGEGSNGGVIEYPAKVRDPMNSIMTILKLYYDEKLLNKVEEILGIKNAELDDVIESLPKYITTSAFSPDGVLRVKVDNFDEFKNRYEKNFKESCKALLADTGFDSYRVLQYEGDEEFIGEGESNRPKNSTGGYRVELLRNGKSEAFLWFSKSRTEALIRLMVDVKGSDKTLHDKLLSFQHDLILKSI